VPRRKKRTSYTPPGKPHHWETAVRSAYFILMGYTVVDAAKSAGIGHKTVHIWMKADWWQDAKDDARDRYLGTVEAETRAAILRGLQDPKEYAAMARWVAERLIPEFAPPKVKAAAVEQRYADEDFVGIDRARFQEMAESRMGEVGEGVH